ncbi:MAG: nitroreductase family protein [Deltaproteobacteria bacterium]|nr:nitroreductase family protein [Deltaproteobacteria bacterium]
MDVFEAMKGRQSIRKFRKEPVPREALLKMVEAASWAPSAGNAQNVRFLVVEDKELLTKMKGIVDTVVSRTTGKPIAPDKINNYNLFWGAPAAVCVIGGPYESTTDRLLREKDPKRHQVRRFQVNAGLQSVSASVTQFLLAAYALGYGTCWMTGLLIAKPELESALSVRFPEELLAVIAVGKPDSPPAKPPRKPPAEITTFR